MDRINRLLGITESYKAPETLLDIILGPNPDRLYMEFLSEFKYDVTYDWFHEYFEEEHADRRTKKQDFTPDSISRLLATITVPDGIYYEPAAGTGGLIVQAWNAQRSKHSVFDYKPDTFFVVAEELSERAIPFLLFNLAIRGINGNVIHCDSLTRRYRNVYFVYNEGNDHLSFSRVMRQPRNIRLEQFFGIRREPNGSKKHID